MSRHEHNLQVCGTWIPRPQEVVPTSSPRQSRMPTEALVRLWLDTFLSENTRKTYAYHIEQIWRCAGRDLHSVSSLWLDEWIKAEQGKGVKVATIKARLAALSSFFNYVEAKVPGYRNPVRGVRVNLPNVLARQVFAIRKKALPSPLLRSLLERLQQDETRLGHEPQAHYLFRMLINTGCRISELLSLESHDPAKESDTYINYVNLQVEPALVFLLGKGNRPRRFVLNPQVAEYLRQKGIPAGQRLFRRPNGKPLSRFDAWRMMKRLEARYLKGERIYRFSPHSTRHSYITAQVQAGQDALNIAKTVGNSRAVIEAFYLADPKNINADFCLL